MVMFLESLNKFLQALAFHNGCQIRGRHSNSVVRDSILGMHNNHQHFSAKRECGLPEDNYTSESSRFGRHRGQDYAEYRAAPQRLE